MQIITEANWTRWRPDPYPKFHQFWFEKVDLDFWYDFGEIYMIPMIYSGISIYLAVIWGLRRYMKDREPFQLRGPLVVWNILVSTFSIVACARFAAEIFPIWNTPHGFYKSACLRDGFHVSTGFWGICMSFSKPVLVIDTLFLLLRKKPLDALHVIHHILAGILAPHIAFFSEPLGRWMGFANLFVHSIDYPLLALTALQIRVPKSRLIMATLEVVQMLFVLFLSAYTLILRASGTYCMRHPRTITLSYVVALVMLIFLAFTLQSPEYWKRSKKRGEINPASKLKSS